MTERFLLVLLSLLVCARGADFYVAPNGLDTNPGTQAEPWQTIQKAADTLQPGDTAWVRTGTYGPVKMNVSGSAEGSVTFRNFTGESPVIDGTGVTPPDDDAALLLLVNRQYVIVDGFELRNFQTDNPVLTPAGIFLRGKCQHIQIRHCRIHDIVNNGGTTENSGNAFGLAVYGTSTTPATDLIIDSNELYDLRLGSSESLSINGNVTHFEVTNNTVHDCNNIGIVFIGYERTCRDPLLDRARLGVCRGNTVYHISSENNQAYPPGDFSAGGIYCDGAAKIVIEGNISHDNDLGIELASEHPGRLTSKITVRDNFIYDNREAGLAMGGYAKRGTGGTAHCHILGNTFFGNDSREDDNGELLLRFRTSDCTVRQNIFYTGPSHLAINIPVGASQNLRNRFDYNLYYHPDGDDSVRYVWNNQERTGLAAWRKISKGDAHALFADPQFVSTGTAPDLHLGAASPAIDAGPATFTPAADEADIDGQPRVSGARVDLGADEVE